MHKIWVPPLLSPAACPASTASYLLPTAPSPAPSSSSIPNWVSSAEKTHSQATIEAAASGWACAIRSAQKRIDKTQLHKLQRREKAEQRELAQFV